MRILILINRIFWIFISFFEKLYWYSWRIEQKRRFQKIGKGVYIDRHCHFTNESISIGNDVYIGKYCIFQSTKSKIIIGSHVMFGPGVSIHGGNHRTDLVGRYMKSIQLKEKLPENDKDVIISDDVWIGANAIILTGVTIGQGSIIGAGSIVSKSVPDYTVLVGNKPQRTYERWDSQNIDKHLKLIEKSLHEK